MCHEFVAFARDSSVKEAVLIKVSSRCFATHTHRNEAYTPNDRSISWDTLASIPEVSTPADLNAEGLDVKSHIPGARTTQDPNIRNYV